jgi:hypothetical protein
MLSKHNTRTIIDHWITNIMSDINSLWVNNIISSDERDKINNILQDARWKRCQAKVKR